MKRNICLIFLLISFSLFSFAGDKGQQPTMYKGKVSCKGQGVAGVVVTDGTAFCSTDKKGNYSIQSTDGAKFVYISSPAGYSVPLNNSVPQFYKPLSSLKKSEKINFELNEIEGGDSKHGFVVWADPQIKANEEVVLLHEAADDLKTLLTEYKNVPFHGLGCGDIVGDNPALFDSVKKMLAPIEIPFYQSMGNHDMQYNGRSNKDASAVFEKNFGPAHYSFNRGEIHYVVLNDVFYIGRDYFYIGYLPEEQLAWLEKDLSFVDKGKMVVVSMHIPSALDDQDLKRFSYSNISQSLANKNALYQILASYQAHIITGHMHVNNNVLVASNIFEHNVSSVCGAWWQGNYAEDGTPKGYAVFEADGDKLSWHFKSVGKPMDYQFRAYPLGSNPEQSEFITANVWNWDPEWKVYWYEDGRRMGEMEAYSGLDPETLKIYSNKENLAYKWITAAQTSHLFRAKPKSASAKITVEVVDRFGNIYKQDLDY